MAYQPLFEAQLGIRNDTWPGLDRDLRLNRRRHAGQWHTLLCDGHVENLETQQLFDRRKDTVLARWNKDHLPHRELLP